MNPAHMMVAGWLWLGVADIGLMDGGVMRGFLFFLTTVVVLVVVAAGCGASSEKLALETYVNGLEPSMETFIDANNSGAKAMKAMQNGSRDYEAFMAHWDEFIVGYRQAADSLRGMSVPASLKDTHARWVGSLVAQAGSGADFQDRLSKYRSTGQVSAQHQATLNKLLTKAQSDQLGVVGAMQSWSKAIGDEMARLKVTRPDWWDALSSQVQYRTTP